MPHSLPAMHVIKIPLFRLVKTPARMGTNKSGIKKPSLAGGHWQRVGRAAFLCAGAPHALARPHAPAPRIRTTRPCAGALRRQTLCSRLVPFQLGRLDPRAGSGRPYILDSFINITSDRVTASGGRRGSPRAYPLKYHMVSHGVVVKSRNACFTTWAYNSFALFVFCLNLLFRQIFFSESYSYRFYVAGSMYYKD